MIITLPEIPRKELKMNWQDEWPECAGLWWFYGYPYGIPKREDHEPELVVGRVIEAGPSDKRFLSFILNGAFLYRNDPYSKAVGKWRKVELPSLPDKL